MRDDLGADFDATILMDYAEGADPDATRESVDAFLEDRFPDTETRDQAEIKKDQESQLDQLVELIYVLLGLSVIISIFGVVNTLALTILERTRELGMLRAIGTSRSQVRRIVRYESVINALLGTIVGAVVGLGLAVAASAGAERRGPGAVDPDLAAVHRADRGPHPGRARRDSSSAPRVAARRHRSASVRVARAQPPWARSWYVPSVVATTSPDSSVRVCLEDELGLAVGGRLLAQLGDKLVRHRRLGVDGARSGPAEVDREALDNGVELRHVEGGERDRAAQELGCGEQHARVHRADVVPVALESASST